MMLVARSASSAGRAPHAVTARARRMTSPGQSSACRVSARGMRCGVAPARECVAARALRASEYALAMTSRARGLVVIEEDARMRDRVREAAARIGAEANAVDEHVLREEWIERRIECAVAEDDFELAKTLVEERRRREGELSPSAALAAALGRRLRDPNDEDAETICADIVQLGDRRLVPTLLRALCVVDAERESAAQAIEHALWMLWQKSGNSHYDARLLDGIRAMSIDPDGLPMARDIFTEIVEAKPDFAEAHNKRATTFYLMQLYDLSIRDCDNVLLLNPQHFGAHSGKGLCYLAMHEYKLALESFEAALMINPRMEHVGRYRESLKTMIDRCEAKQFPEGDDGIDSSETED